MSMTLFYLCVTVFSLCGVWAVWELGFKAVFLDGFRQRLFELRMRLFSLAESGVLSYDDDAYRAIETLLNGLIRYAHRLSFIVYVSSVWEISRAKREDKDYVDFAQQLSLKISRLDPDVQIEISNLLSKVHSAVCILMAANSLVFKLIYLVYVVARLFRPKEVESKVTQQVFVLEREAYLSAKSRTSYATH
jgi:hypothetical protein